MKRPLLQFAAACLCVLLLTVLGLAAENGGPLSDLQVNVCGGEQDAMETVRWMHIGNEWYLFLPEARAQTRVFFTSTKPVKAGGQTLENGAVSDLFDRDGTLTLRAGLVKYRLTVLHNAVLPELFLTTESGSLDYLHADKNNREPGSLRLYEDGRETLSAELRQIKGRGNTSWKEPKKGYNLRFLEKTALLGMPAAKKWTLLPSYSDTTLARNELVLELGRTTGLPETSECRQVSLFINGQYHGVYQLCESVEVGPDRVAVADLEKANKAANPEVGDLDELPLAGVRDRDVSNTAKWVELPKDPEDISGGYLLENDVGGRYLKERSGFISATLEAYYSIKSPEHASREEAQYIAACWNRMEQALYAPTGRSSDGRHFMELLDQNSLLRTFLIEEYVKDLDVGISSTYYYKREGDDRIYVGPLWDFDHSLGVTDGRYTYLHPEDPSTWYANRFWMQRNARPFFYTRCYAFPEFRTAAQELWFGEFSEKLHGWMPSRAEELCEALETAAVMDHVRWRIYGTTDTDTVRMRYRADAEELLDFIRKRTQALDLGFSERGAMVSYDSNGGSSVTYDIHIYTVGDTAVSMLGKSLKREGYFLSGWNTAPDGSGTAVGLEAPFTVTENYMILYAQWAKEE